jgi:Tol biopolymer transport system component
MQVSRSGRKLAIATGVVLCCQTLTATGVSAAVAGGELILVSASATGEPGNGQSSFGVSVSADGRYVAFASMATNLEPTDPDTVVDVFVKDLSTGVVQLASQTAGGIKADAISERPSISADGHKVAFVSAADNLDADDPDGFPDVYVKDLQTGDLTLVSRGADGAKADTGAVAGTLSADGSTVAFSSSATNLVAGAVAGSHVYVKSLDSGALTLVDGGGVVQPDQQSGAGSPELSADGQVVAFTTDAALDAADTDQRSDVYVRNLDSGELLLASANADGTKAESPATSPSISADGTLVAFATASANLVPEDVDDSSDVYLKNLTDGSLTLESTDAAGSKANQSADYPALSADGGYLAFSSDATNLGLDTPPLVKQAYRKDLHSGELQPVSVTADGVPGDSLSIEPAVAGDGSVVAFYSPSTNLVPDGDNRVADVMAKQFPAPAAPDSVPPTADLTVSPSWLRANSGEQCVLIAGSARDDGGIASVAISATDEYGEDQPVIEQPEVAGEVSVAWQRQVTLDTTLRRGDWARIYTITATVSDVAGNITTNSTREVIRRWTRPGGLIDPAPAPIAGSSGAAAGPVG